MSLKSMGRANSMAWSRMALIRSWTCPREHRQVFELHVGDEELNSGWLFHLKGGRGLLFRWSPFAVVDPYQDSYVNQERAGVCRHLSLGEEAPVNEEGHREERDEPEGEPRRSTDIVPPSFLAVGLFEALFDASVLSFGHESILWLSCSVSIKLGYLSVAGTTRHLPRRR